MTAAAAPDARMRFGMDAHALSLEARFRPLTRDELLRLHGRALDCLPETVAPLRVASNFAIAQATGDHVAASRVLGLEIAALFPTERREFAWHRTIDGADAGD